MAQLVRIASDMIVIPGFVISLITFPGVIVHELAHVLCCKLTRTEVHKVCLFRLGNPAGYVIHATPKNVWQHILIGIGPLFVNTLITFIIGLTMRKFHLGHGFFEWLAVSIAANAFPSKGDAESIWKAVWAKGSPYSARILGTPLVLLIAAGTAGSVFLLNFLYAYMCAFWLPRALA
jgi:hypothetical protein